MKEEKTLEQINLEIVKDAMQSGSISISKETAAMFQAILKMEEGYSELLSAFEFDSMLDNRQIDTIHDRLSNLYTPFYEAAFREIGAYIGRNAFKYVGFNGL